MWSLLSAALAGFRYMPLIPLQLLVEIPNIRCPEAAIENNEITKGKNINFFMKPLFKAPLGLHNALK